MSFSQSPTWVAATVSICVGTETPDNLAPWRQVFRLLKRRAQFDVVVTMAPRPSLFYGLFCALLGLRSKQIMTEVFLDEARPHSLDWRIKTGLFQWIARRSLGVLTNSSAEVGFVAKRFCIPENKVLFVPMYTTVQNPSRSPHNDGFILSIGRSGRDWKTLLQAATQFAAPLKIVVGSTDALPDPPPPQVQVLREIPLEQGHELMRRASVIVIPLLPAERSTGQVVLFEAMAMGKPVVATRATGTADYIRDGENGLLVEPGDVPALALAVNRLLQDPALARCLADAALADCATVLNIESHAAHKLKTIHSLWENGTLFEQP